ncbi:hypothetical protein GLYMA_04G168351v4 [Glycine max]|nr:hypothetical protein GLYMA_04G168351v4 [Glycine max]KAH1111745.1 hypothetical protein GYH30_010198 [Glycine max]
MNCHPYPGIIIGLALLLLKLTECFSKFVDHGFPILQVIILHCW